MKYFRLFVDFSIEYFIILKNQFLALFLKKPPQAWQHGTKGTVVLIPGFGETWIFLRPVADFVNSLGYKVLVVEDLGNNLASLDESVKCIKVFTEEHKLSDIVFICHSKGGVISTMLLHDPKYSPKIKQIFNLATPYGGTVLAFLKLFNLNELSPESKLIRGLKAPKAENAKIINLYAQLDNHVIPNRHLTIEGAKNIKIDVVGHERIVGARKTLEVVKKYLGS